MILLVFKHTVVYGDLVNPLILNDYMMLRLLMVLAEGVLGAGGVTWITLLLHGNDTAIQDTLSVKTGRLS